MSQQMTVDQALELAKQLRTAGRRPEAQAICTQILVHESTHPGVLNLLGILALEDDDAPRAAGLFRQAMQSNPGSPQQHSNLGAALGRLGQFDEAIAEYQKAIALNPHYVKAWHNMSAAFRGKGDIARAVEACRKAVELEPGNTVAREMLGVTLLLNGELEQGWAMHESRPQVREFLVRHQGQPMWDGSPLNGRTILVQGEQGFGDTIHFVRYLPLLAQSGARVVFECQGELVGLVKSMSGIERIVARGEPAGEFDVCCLLLSLPHLLKTTLANVPNQVPYLRADAQRMKHWKDRVSKTAGDRIKVGLNWAGRIFSDVDRSIPPASLALLNDVPNVCFFNLKKTDGSHSPPTDFPAGMALTDWTSELTDFAETAALVENLDLVISVDTAVAHLAGALGKPVWTLLNFLPDWRWMMNRPDSPWYPTMRLFRQAKPGDWSQPLAHVVQALQSFKIAAG